MWFHLYHAVQHWLAYETGSENTAGAPPNYNFWSGFGSDLGEATLVAAVLGIYHKHNCHQKRCLWIGRHLVDGTPWCNRHHEEARSAQR